jgi:hypothetical protein
MLSFVAKRPTRRLPTWRSPVCGLGTWHWPETPGWRAFDDAYPVTIFDAAGGGVQADPRGDEHMI